MLGKFITFEGGEGTGKSTQVKLLTEYLKKQMVDVVVTKEPGGTDVGLEIRKILLEGDKDKMDPIAEVLMYYADRRIHLTKKIWPALGDGKWVISDRFADSTVAYQYYGYNKRVEMSVLEELYKLVVGDKKPDLTIILDLDVGVGLNRSFVKAEKLGSNELRHESRGKEFHENLRKGFWEIAKTDSKRCVILDAEKSIDELHKDVVKVVSERFGL